MRSRHCKDEPAFIHVTGEIWEGESEAMSPSQENCLFDNHRYVPTSDRKGIGVCWLQCFLVYLSIRNLTCHFWVARFFVALESGCLAYESGFIIIELMDTDFEVDVIQI